jgi:hypothetical protein
MFESSEPSFLERAFAAGATHVDVYRFLDEYRASVSAFQHHADGPRSISSRAAAEGHGPTPEAAIQDALDQLALEVAPTAEEVVALEVAEQAALPAREVIEPEILDPPLRYAVPGRPGTFVTREEAQRHGS